MRSTEGVLNVTPSSMPLPLLPCPLFPLMLTAKFRSMRARVTALFALFVALLMGAGGAAVQHRENSRAGRRSREILAVALERARVEIVDEGAGKRTLLQAVVADDNEIAAGGLAMIVVRGERVLWRSRAHSPNWPRVSRDWRYATISRGGQTLVLARDWAPIAEDLRETARALWMLGILIVGATTLAAWLLVGKTLSPLDELANQAQNASIESLAVRLRAPSSDAEMLHLTRTLNDLLGRLERESQGRGRFYAAASHELRTPIQSLLGEVEVTLARPRSGPFYREALGQIHDETKRLKTLVQDLLQLNALEMRQSQSARETLDLRDWTQRALAQQSVAIAARNLQVETDLKSAPIEAPPAHLEILLRNLLENAVKYATPASPLKLEVQSSAEGAQLRVWNAYPLPAEADLNGWFEPFFRPDEARNSQTGGNGLGLSIVAALARANNWKVELSAREAGVMAQVCFNENK